MPLVAHDRRAVHYMPRGVLDPQLELIASRFQDALEGNAEVLLTGNPEGTQQSGNVFSLHDALRVALVRVLHTSERRQLIRHSQAAPPDGLRCRARGIFSPIVFGCHGFSPFAVIILIKWLRGGLYGSAIHAR